MGLYIGNVYFVHTSTDVSIEREDRKDSHIAIKVVVGSSSRGKLSDAIIPGKGLRKTPTSILLLVMEQCVYYMG